MNNAAALPKNQLALLGLSHIAAKCALIAAEKKLGQLLLQAPLTTQEIATRLGFNTHATVKFLRVLNAYDIIDYSNDQASSTNLTKHLDCILSPHLIQGYTAIDHLEHTLRTDQASWEQAFNQPFYPYLQATGDKLHQFEDWCTLTAKDWLPAAFDIYDFHHFKHIVDIGGGQGHFLATILENSPEIEGTLFDQPTVIEKAKLLVSNHYSVGHRLQFVTGDFFSGVPQEGDAYIICRTLLNWNDEKARQIINNCYKAMPAGGKLLIVDFVLPEQTHPAYKRAVLSDINLLTILESSNRTKAEWLNLVNQSLFSECRYFAAKDDAPPGLIMPLCVIEAIKS
jgi:ubiquinone/menaquinone biosynthesis C-methylase UbiE